MLPQRTTHTKIARPHRLTRTELEAECERLTRALEDAYTEIDTLKARLRARTRTVNIPRPIRALVRFRDQDRCRYCGVQCTDQSYQLDHIIPVPRGGPHTMENLVVCCRSCNLKKRDRTPEEAGMTLIDEAPDLEDRLASSIADTYLRIDAVLSGRLTPDEARALPRVC